MMSFIFIYQSWIQFILCFK